jgi:transketolase
MRDAFLDELYEIARKDSRVLLLSNDFGAPSLDKYRADLPGQFIHIGIAEQNMVNLSAGLAMAGKIVYMYSISPFLPLRCYEQMRVHMGFKHPHITAVAVGAGYSYDLSGPSHEALEDIALMDAIPGMTIFSGSDAVQGAAFARMTYEGSGPAYVRFDREKLPMLYEEGKKDFSDGLAVLRNGKDVTIVSTGIMVHQVLKVAEELKTHSLDAGVIDLYRIKPLNETMLLTGLKKSKRVVTVEENFRNSGIGSIISDLITDNEPEIRLKRLGIPDKFFTQGGSRLGLQRLSGLDVESLTKTTLDWLGAPGK